MPGTAQFNAVQAMPKPRTVFRAYTFCIFTMVFCVNAPAPLFDLFRRTSGLGPGELSMLYAVYAGIVIATLPFFGHASDRVGRRVLVGIGLFLIAGGSLLLAKDNVLLWLIGGRFLQGLGVAAMSAPAAAALAELAGTQSQASAASTMAVTLAAGGALAPLFSGIVAEAFPAFPTFSLLACAALAFFGMIIVALLPDPWHSTTHYGSVLVPTLEAAAAQRDLIDPAVQESKGPVADADCRRAFWLACITVFLCFGAQTTFFTVSGPIFATLLASHVLLTAGCAMSALMVASAVGGALAKRVGATTAITISMLALAPGVCGFFGLVGLVPLALLLPAVAAIGFGHGLGYAGAMRLINETAQSPRRGIYTSKFYVAIYAGGGAPVLGMGLLQGEFGRTAASDVFSSAVALTAVALLLLLATKSLPKR